VAQAARTLQGVIVNDVAATPAFMPNPLLPDTRSEMAIPMIVGNRVLGVLDVQADRLNAFTDEDVRIHIVLASQVAATLQNVRFYEELQQTAQRLKEVDRLKNEFLANMSHELRTPLNSVLGYAEVLLTGLDGDISEEQREDVQSIYDNGKHLLNLINDVLDLAKIEAGRMALKMEEVDIAELLEQVRKNSLGMVHALQRPLEVVAEIDPDLPVIVADPVRISQVFNNLLSNAIKFSEKGTISIRAYRSDEWLSVKVQDEGIGIRPEDQEKIFERFSQADGSTTRRAEGTGLGLPISYHLVTMHGGSIEVESESGKGSVFTIRLPISEPQQVPA
jgi:signal transduction histidine kinase